MPKVYKGRLLVQSRAVRSLASESLEVGELAFLDPSRDTGDADV